MKKVYILLVFITAILQGQPDTLWTKTFDYFDFGVGTSVQQTMDGGYILTGFNYSPVSSIIIKTDSNGEEEWVQYSSSIDYSVQQTTDGGYIITGWESGDIHLTKTDENGNVEWSQTFGGDGQEGGRSVKQTTDGGYIITGYTESYGLGGTNVWLIKTDSSGDTTWTKTFGGSEHDEGNSVQQTTDGGYIITGFSQSFWSMNDDFWLIKTDSEGNTEWEENFDGDGDDISYSVQQTSDGGYIITGSTGCWDNCDVWLIKTDSNGDSLWTRTFGGSSSDIGRSVKETTDGGYIIAGSTWSFGNGEEDIWLIKTDSLGQEVWNQTFGGSANDEGWSVQQTSDDDYIITGSRNTGTTHRIWLIKTVRESLSNIVINEIMQNPSSVSDANGEWFELYNAGEDTVDISGWVFKDTDDDSLSLDVDCCINIPPNGYFLMICNWDTATNGGISNYDFVYEREAFNLGNGDDEIIIIDSYGREVDRVEYDGGTNFPDPNGLSMELIYHNLDNNDANNWVESVNMLPSGDYGTPGEGNSTLQPSLMTNINADCQGGVNNGWMELGDIEINDSSECMLFVENAGYGELIISNIHIGESQNDYPNTAFSVTVDSLIIPPEGSDSIVVYFYPEVAGFYNGSLSFETNDVSNPTHNEAVHGTGLSPVREIFIETDFASDTIYYYDAPLGDSTYAEYAYITNIGLTTLEIDDIVATEPFYVFISDASLDLLEYLELPIFFIPDSEGSYSGTVTIYSNDSDEEEVIINLYGETETLSIDEIPIPDKFTLHQNYPNPFNPVTSIQYELPENAFVNIRIYDLKGRSVNTLVSKGQTAGYKSIKWAGVDDKGKALSAGIYLYEIQAGNFRDTKKMVLLK